MSYNGKILNERVYFQGVIRGCTTNADGTIMLKIDCQLLPDEVVGRLVSNLHKKHIGVVVAPYELLNEVTFELLDEAVRVVTEP